MLVVSNRILRRLSEHYGGAMISSTEAVITKGLATLEEQRWTAL